MRKVALAAIMLALSVCAQGSAPGQRQIVDLRGPHALERLEKTDPSHFEIIRKIVAGLREEPQRAESDWLTVNFHAQDVDLSRHLLRTTNPPKQLLRFRLDDVQYLMYVTRADLTATGKKIK